jgi:pimeloyl-ACP methyl ester carboxylesterase
MIDNEAEPYRRALRNPKAVKALTAIGPDPTAWDLGAWEVRMRWSRDNKVLGKLFPPLVLGREVYGWRDLRHLAAGFGYSKEALFADFMRFRAEARFQVPVVCLQGADDDVTVRSLADDYFARVDAPSKRMALIEGAGHFAAVTHPTSSWRCCWRKWNGPSPRGEGTRAVPGACRTGPSRARRVNRTADFIHPREG